MLRNKTHTPSARFSHAGKLPFDIIIYRAKNYVSIFMVNMKTKKLLCKTSFT